MIVIPAVQGSQAWLDARKGCFTASELPAAAGASKYQSRADLLKQKATGISPDVDSRTQALFDKGHAVEATARSFAEEIIGEELSPITGMREVEGMKLLASFDGITFDGDVIWEHKLWNEKLAEDVRNKVLDRHYLLQMDQQLLVSKADRCLFMVSDGTKENMVWMWHDTASADSFEIINTWKQFAKDLAAYVPAEVKEAPKAEAIIALPSVFVQATGMVTASNLAEFKEAATTFIANIKTELISDDDFAQAEATVKFCKDAEVNLEATKASVLAQMSTVDEVVRTLDHIAAQLRDKRLMLDKLVKSEKDARRQAIVIGGGTRYAEHITALQIPVLYMPLMPRVDFGAAVKGLKSLSSMQDKVDALLANTKIEADAIARDINAKLSWCKESSTGFGFLFSDLSNLIANNGMEAFQAIVNGRIAQHKTDEAAKEEATRLRIQQEEEAKAQAKAKAEQDAIVAKAIAEQKAIDAAAQHQYEKALAGEKDVIQATQVQRGKSEEATHAEGKRDPMPQAPSASTPPISATIRASRAEILEVLAENFGRPEEVMLDWIIAEFAGDIQFAGRKAA